MGESASDASKRTETCVVSNHGNFLIFFLKKPTVCFSAFLKLQFLLDISHSNPEQN